MFTKFYEMMMITLLITGTIVASSSSSWFTSWMGLELNLLMIIPLIINKFNSSSTEATIKYFLVQAMSSLMFLALSLMSFLFFKSNLTINSDTLILFTLMIKAGIPPFYFWFPQVIETIAWKQCFIMLTWQKIAPFMLFSFMFNNPMFSFFIILSAMIGAFGGFNQNSMKKILTYSSISHSSWMISIISYNFKIWLNYFLIYSLISLGVISLMMTYNIKKIKEMIFKKMSFSFKMMFSLNMFSLAGLPPLLGFLGKFMIIMKLLEFNFGLFIVLILIISSLISLFFYFKTIYFLLTFNSTFNNFNKMIKHYSTISNPIMIYSIMLNLLMPYFIVLT